MAIKFYKCPTCGNIAVKIEDSGVGLVCCGSPMQELDPAISEGAEERHLPVAERLDDKTVLVKVGSEPHPMAADHHIVFICMETVHGGQIRYLDPSKPAEALFDICKDRPIAVYVYCNIHGLWKADIREEAGRRKRSCCGLL